MPLDQPTDEPSRFYVIFGSKKNPSCFVVRDDREEAFSLAKEMPEGKPLCFEGRLVEP